MALLALISQAISDQYRNLIASLVYRRRFDRPETPSEIAGNASDFDFPALSDIKHGFKAKTQIQAVSGDLSSSPSSPGKIVRRDDIK
ncbi:MAG: hypothetical protein A2W80_12925 [Candidatus Riflebacteria bacterium GWC2_50_8]|nr:MAG: hypothetical protein A2W80_12925 [Candidatus Riflebacteria bacterium GWC2_50_8]